MAACQTKYDGIIEFTDDSVFVFPEGLIGFEGEISFLPLQPPGAEPLVLLQSTITPELCFIALPVRVVDPEYQLAIVPEDLPRLGLPANRQPAIGADVLCLALITIHDGGEGTTANLLAPVVVNLKTRRAVQCISSDPGHSHQHPFLAPAEASPCS